jgi:hypothetical protein
MGGDDERVRMQVFEIDNDYTSTFDLTVEY